MSSNPDEESLRPPGDSGLPGGGFRSSAQTASTQTGSVQIAPYGSWPSPLTAQHVAAGSAPISRARYAGTRDATVVYYSQRVPHEASRIGIFANRSGHPEAGESVLPAPYSAHSRVHEYGGGAWEVSTDEVVTFVNSDDQRLYRFTACQTATLVSPTIAVNRAAGPTATTPIPLTPETGGAVRYGDLVYSGTRLLAVRETHGAGGIDHAVVEITDTGVTELAAGPGVPHFVAFPRVSPDGRYLAFIGWEHPNMPWDETKLYIAEAVAGERTTPPATASNPPPTGAFDVPVAVFGTPGESVLQPEWLSSTWLSVTADRTDTWQIYQLHVPTHLAAARGEPGTAQADPLPMFASDGEIGGPLWNLGARWYLPVHGGNRILAESRYGASRAVWAGEHGSVDYLDCELTNFSLQDYRDGVALVLGGGPDMITGLYTFDVTAGHVEALALSAQLPMPAAYLPHAKIREFDGVHAVVYPPHSPGYRAPDGELAPYVAFVHGGPTSQATAQVNLHHAYFTSRGIGVVDVNYSGSTGYGRAYRDALKGRWGRADVSDTVTVLRALAADGHADLARMAISGGSAGGWTVLNALTSTDFFACGADYFGVAELEKFVSETHDFESQYAWRLLGVDPEQPDRAAALAELAPLSHLDQLSVPVAIFQGEQDPIVPPSQARRLITGLESAGLPYLAEFYPNESHGFTHVDNIVASLAAELGFYGRMMGFATPGVPAPTLHGRGR